jgi:hypothetical protein
MFRVILLLSFIPFLFSCCSEEDPSPEKKPSVGIPDIVNPDQISGRNLSNPSVFSFQIPEIQGFLITTSVVNGNQFPDLMQNGYFRAYGNVNLKNEFYSVKKTALKNGWLNGWSSANQSAFSHWVQAGTVYTFIWNTDWQVPWFLNYTFQGYFDPLLPGDKVLVTKLIVNFGDADFSPSAASSSVRKVIYYDKSTGKRQTISQSPVSTPSIPGRSGIGQSYWMEYKGGGVYEAVMKLDTNKVVPPGVITKDSSSNKTVDLIKVY